MTTNNIDRRKFLKAGAGAGAALVGGGFVLNRFLSPSASGSENFPPRAGAPVVRATSPALSRKSFDEGRATEILGRSIALAVGEKDPKKALRILFRPSDVIGLKLNCLAGPMLSSSVQLVRCIVKLLVESGVPENRIVLWDRTTRELRRAGFSVNIGRSGVRCFGTDHRLAGYEADIRFSRSVGSCFSRILTEICTAIINVPILKDHDLAGVSLGMKNYFGAIHNPNKYHDNHCSPFVADLASYPMIREKERLVICDCTRAVVDGGPAYKPSGAWDCRSVLVSRDPVAIDRVGMEMIEDKRREKGMRSLAEAGRPVLYIDVAAKLGLGEGNLEKIKVVET